MAKSSFIDFKAVKAAITMEQVLGHYGLLDKFKRGTDSFSGPCPLHKGSNPTQFRVSISKNIWNCFSECKHGGNVLDFIAEMEKASIHAAALKAIEWFNLNPEEVSANVDQETDEKTETPTVKEATQPKPVSKPAPVVENAAPNVPLKFRLDKLERGHPYLTGERGLTLETIVDFGMGFCSKGMMEGRIAIPIHNVKGEVVAYAGRWPGEPPDEETQKYKLPKGYKKSQDVFNLDRVIKEPSDKPLIIVEGFFDVIKLHQLGYRRVVAIMGDSMSAAQEELIRQQVSRSGHVVVMLDENPAGQVGRDDIALRLSRHCFVRIHAFEKEDMEPEHLTAEEVQQIIGDVP